MRTTRTHIGLAIAILILVLLVQTKAQSGIELTAQERAVKVTIALADKYDAVEAKNGFKFKENIYVLISMTNSTAEMIYVPVSYNFYQNRPELFKEGLFVPYRKGISERLKELETNECKLFRNMSLDLEPNKTGRIDYFNLDEWYEPLEPGTYQLKLYRAFTSCHGAMTESDVIEFYVLP